MAILPKETKRMLKKIEDSLIIQDIFFQKIIHSSNGRFVIKNISDILVFYGENTHYLTVRQGKKKITFKEIEKQYNINLDLFKGLKKHNICQNKKIGFLFGFDEGEKNDNLIYVNINALEKIKESRIDSFASNDILNLETYDENCIVRHVNIVKNKNRYDMEELLNQKELS